MQALSNGWNHFTTSTKNFWDNQIKAKVIDGKIKPFYQEHKELLAWQNMAIMVSGIALAALALVGAAFLIAAELMPFVVLGAVAIVVIAGFIVKTSIEKEYNKQAWARIEQIRQAVHQHATRNDPLPEQVNTSLNALNIEQHPKFSHLKKTIKEIQKKIDNLQVVLQNGQSSDVQCQNSKKSVLDYLELIQKDLVSGQAIPALV